MVKKYIAKSGCIEIQPVFIERETDSSVWINGRRKSKQSEYENYFDTIDEAKQFIIQKAKNEVSQYQNRLEMAEKHYDHIVKALIKS